MFKFLKDFLFEENEVAVATPTATGSVTSLGEKVDKGGDREEPAGKMGDDKPFWPEPKAASDEPKTSDKPSLMLDIQPVQDKDDESSILSGSPIDLDDSTGPEVVAPVSEVIKPTLPEPGDEKVEAAPENSDAPVMEMSPQAESHENIDKSFADEPKEEAPNVVELKTDEPKIDEPAELPKHDDEAEQADDMAKIANLMTKTEAEIKEEEEAIAKFEAEAKDLAEKIESRRGKLSHLRDVTPELEKAKADLEILLRNRQELESKIGDISSQLDASFSTDKPQ